MKNWFFLFVIIAFALLQVTVLDYFKIFKIKPDLLLISVIIISLYFELKSTLFLSIFTGILKDTFLASPFAINTLLFPLWGFLTIKLSKKVSLDNNFTRSISIFIIMVLNSTITRLIFLFFGKFISWGIYLRIALFESLYTALIFPIIFRIIKPILTIK